MIAPFPRVITLNLHLLIAGAFLALANLSSAELPAGVSSVPLRAPSRGEGATLFSSLTPEQSGIAFVNRVEVTHPMSFLYHSGMTTGGVAVADFDGDGLPDIFFAGTTDKNRLFRQTKDLQFEEITANAGPIDGGDNWSSGAAAADVNGDGRIDLYVCNYEKPNQLFINMGKGPAGEAVVFKEVAELVGLAAVDCSHSAAFADYDGDGLLDMYLLTNRIEDPNGTPADKPVINNPDGTVSIKPEFARYYHVWRLDYERWGTEAIGTDDRLYRNLGNGPDGLPRFKDVSKDAGIIGRGDGLSCTWWDYNGDGLLDIYVANDFIAGDKLYRNNGNGTFTNTIAEAMPHTPWFSMGADFGDVNNDLLPDFLVADMSATSHYKSKTTMGVMGGIDLHRSYFDQPKQIMQNAFYLNTGTERFMEAARLFKISSTDWTWAVKFADFDVDGWQDLYFTNGISRHMNDSDIKLTADMLTGKHMFEFFKNGEMRKEQHRAYRNAKGEKFDEVGKEWGLDHVGVAYGAAYADLDRDGDLDLIVVNLEEPNSVYRNDASTGHRLLVTLEGSKANRQGLGATVIVRTKSGSQMRQLQPQTGYHSCNEALVHFGLGKEDTIEELTVRWPGGGVQRIKGLKADQHYTIKQPTNGGEQSPPSVAPATMFAQSDALSFSESKDAGWDIDFQKQSLLPLALSQLGPALAWGDVDGDGDDDYYFGGSAGMIGELRLNDGKGKFIAKWVDAFRADKDCEDQGAVFLDVDGDGDLDLLVASGTNEVEAGSKSLRDRLYLNNGKGSFIAAKPGTLPEAFEFSSAVAVADYDRDGRPDIFLGARTVPGDWPHAGRSRLLHNESAGDTIRFVDVTLRMTGLDNVGLVTGALWSDADGDGWVDLLIPTEWGAVKYFRNTNGQLSDQTATAGLADMKGWWRGIAAADIDHDGDLDYVVTNLGLNTKYKQPSAGHPHLMYYGDFDGTGRSKIVEVKQEGEALLPERGRSCSSTAMPFIKEKFPTFHLFAKASLEEVYSAEKLQKAERYEATEFRSGLLVNEGGRFRFEPLPQIAQVAPGFGAVFCDADGDGHVDLYLAQNFLGPQIECCPFDGGLSQLLRGDGKGAFTPVEHRRSGLIVSGDAKSATVADINADGKPDFAVTVNSGKTAAFTNQSNGRWLRVNLPRNVPNARVTLRSGKAAPQLFEVSAGSGYLGQSSATAWFGLGEHSSAGTVSVIWPDGSSSEAAFDGQPGALSVTPRPRQVAR